MVKLSSLPEGTNGIITKIDEINHTFYDLGIIEGTVVKCVKKNKGIGAYLIKDCVIALRDEETRKIFIEIGELNG